MKKITMGEFVEYMILTISGLFILFGLGFAHYAVFTQFKDVFVIVALGLVLLIMDLFIFIVIGSIVTGFRDRANRVTLAGLIDDNLSNLMIMLRIKLTK